MTRDQIAWMLLADPDFAKHAAMSPVFGRLLNRITAAGSNMLNQTATAGGIAAPILAAALGFGRGEPDQKLPPRQVRQPVQIDQPAQKIPLREPTLGEM